MHRGVTYRAEQVEERTRIQQNYMFNIFVLKHGLKFLQETAIFISQSFTSAVGNFLAEMTNTGTVPPFPARVPITQHHQKPICTLRPSVGTSL